MSSKFMLLAHPFMFPGKTICCGKTKGPVIDFGMNAESEGLDGAVYWCVDCIVEAALITGEVVKPSEQVTVSPEVVREAQGHLDRLSDGVTSWNSSLDAFRNLIADFAPVAEINEAGSDSSGDDSTAGSKRSNRVSDGKSDGSGDGKSDKPVPTAFEL